MYELSMSELKFVHGGSGKAATGAVQGGGAYLLTKTIEQEKPTAGGLVGATITGAISSSSTHSVMVGVAAGKMTERVIDFIEEKLKSNPVKLGPGLMIQPDTNHPPISQNKCGTHYG